MLSTKVSGVRWWFSWLFGFSPRALTACGPAGGFLQVTLFPCRTLCPRFSPRLQSFFTSLSPFLTIYQCCKTQPKDHLLSPAFMALPVLGPTRSILFLYQHWNNHPGTLAVTCCPCLVGLHGISVYSADSGVCWKRQAWPGIPRPSDRAPSATWSAICQDENDFVNLLSSWHRYNSLHLTAKIRGENI